MQGLRSIEGPYVCDDGVLFHSIRGLESVAVSISTRGSIINETVLERGALVLGTANNCDPVVFQEGEVSRLDTRGAKRWSLEFGAQPLYARVGSNFLFLLASAKDPVALTLVNDF